MTHLKLIPSSATPEEAAAIVAALERFMRATAPAAGGPAPTTDPWREAALLEGVSRGLCGCVSHPWINT